MSETSDGRRRTALWVHAHPRSASLNGRLFDIGTAALASRYEVTTSNLYAEGFDPVLREADLGALARSAGNLGELLAQAYEAGELADEIRAEQDKLAAADLLVVQFPLWWYGPPAILKGWFDRVITGGFAFGEVDPELGVPLRYGDGRFAGRRALIVVTAGEDARTLGPRGISGDLESLLFPLTHGVLWYIGIETVDLHVIYDADGIDGAGVEREIERLRERLRHVDTEPVRPFRRLRDGDYRGTRALREDLAPGRVDLGIHRTDAE